MDPFISQKTFDVDAQVGEIPGLSPFASDGPFPSLIYDFVMN